jgi:hypothetical protein
LADVFLSDSIILNIHVIKKGMIFFTAPYYILEICEAQFALYKQGIHYEEGSTAENFVIDGKVCFSTVQGNTA